jgi:hypothetical protein
MTTPGLNVPALSQLLPCGARTGASETRFQAELLRGRCAVAEKTTIHAAQAIPTYLRTFFAAAISLSITIFAPESRWTSPLRFPLLFPSTFGILSLSHSYELFARQPACRFFYFPVKNISRAKTVKD